MIYSLSGDGTAIEDVIISEARLSPAIKGNQKSHAKQTITALVNRNTSIVPKLYSSFDNLIKETPIVWAEFIDMKMQQIRSGHQELDSKALNGLLRCPSSTVSNSAAKLSDRDKLWCEWAAKSDGGKVRAGETYGVLKPDERDRYERLSCNNIAKGWNPSCEEVRFSLSDINS